MLLCLGLVAAGWAICWLSLRSGDGLWRLQWQRMSLNERDAVERVIRQGNAADSEPHFVPNALWHHGLNSRLPSHQINSLGFRSPEISPPRLAAGPRVICMGDSTTENCLRPMEDAWPSLLQEHLGAKAVVLNAGVGSMTSNLVANYLSNRVIHFDPHVVIVKVGYNDIWALCRSLENPYDYTEYFVQPFTAPQIDAAFMEDAKKSYAGKVRLAHHLRMLSEASYGCRQPPLDSLVVVPQNFKLFRGHLMAIVGIARANGAEPILLDLPVPTEGSADRFEPLGGKKFFLQFVATANAEIAAVAKEMRVPLVVVQSAMATDDFWDHCHLERSGNAKTAEAVAPVVEALLDKIGAAGNR